MTDFWDQPAKLMRTHDTAGGWKGSRRPEQASVGSLSQLVERIAAEDPEDIWRFVLVTNDGKHIRSADLRELIRRHGLRATSR
jgi:predicted RNA-binding Zn ribbon-like protein